jgi:cytochrome c
MKKLLALALSLASIGLAASSAEAKTTKTSTASATNIAVNAPAPQWRNRNNRWDRRNNRRVYVTTQTRLVRYGRQLFRETYQVRHLPNGRTVARLISRVRVR